MARRINLSDLFFGAALGLWGLLVLLPLLKVLGAMDWSLFFQEEVVSVARLTLLQGLWSMGLSLVFGLSTAPFLMGSSVQGLLALPFVLPTLLTSIALLSVFGKSGFLGFLGLHYSLAAVIFAHVFLNGPWVAVQLARRLEQYDPRWLEASQTMGASRFFEFLNLRLRWLAPVLIQAALQVFSLCLTSFTVVLLLGGGPPVDSLETLLFFKIRGGEVDLKGAQAVALWQLLFALLIFGLSFKWRKRAGGLRLIRETYFSTSRWTSFGWCFLILLVPYLSFFSKDAFDSLANPSFFAEILKALWVSAKISFLGAGVAVALALGLLSGQKPWQKILTDLLTAFSASLSVLLLSLGFWLLYSEWVDPFEGSLVAICLIQGVVFFTLVFRILHTPMREQPLAWIDAAKTLGASPIRVWWTIQWPRLRRPLLSAFVWAAMCCLGEVAAVSFFYSEDLVPLSLLAARLAGQYQFGQARAVSLFLMILVFCLLWLSERRRERRSL